MPNTYNVALFNSADADNKKFAQLLARHHSVQRVVAISDVKKSALLFKSTPFSLSIILGDTMSDECDELISLAICNDPKMNVMMVSKSTNSDLLVRAAKLGVTGFLPENERPIVMCQAIQQMFTNGSYIHPDIAPTLLKAMTNSPSLHEVSAGLTSRENDILICIAKGCSSTEIAGLLNISSHTVSSHVKNIYRKLDIHSKGEAVVEAIRMGLIDINRSEAG
ncbi:MAG: response regulator transcription factor [Agarilytica sp.]